MRVVPHQALLKASADQQRFLDPSAFVRSGVVPAVCLRGVLPPHTTMPFYALTKYYTRGGAAYAAAFRGYNHWPFPTNGGRSLALFKPNSFVRCATLYYTTPPY